MSDEYAIQVMNLTKYYGKLLAVDHIDLEVNPGEVFGFLGPNGAGKTTTVKMLNTLLEPTGGKAYIFGYDVSRQPYQAKRQFGVVPEESNVYTEISTWDNMIFTARLYRIPGSEQKRRIDELLELMELQGKKNDKVFTLSKGMRQRLSLAMALIHRPSVLFLDEPILGLDVHSSRIINNQIRQLNTEGTTIFLTTHQIEMADELCHRVAIINHGQIAAVETPERLKAAVEGKRSVEITMGNGGYTKECAGLAGLSGVKQAVRNGDKVRLFTSDPPTVLRGVMGYIQERNLPVVAINTTGPSLEDVFVDITGRPIGAPRRKFASEQCKGCPVREDCESEKEATDSGQAPKKHGGGFLKGSCER